ncbi:carbohydrate esterase family 8 protein [Sphaerobolus stellatus SS14]|uniref:pectinesterase n=1 Tax=Sphaerobolus stellatus (strain SS14) TaxID=990650 RepID=A0A0C9UM66_SPHS4|nr:carbohydrate esterase family 8 protein [Sphaerobolus stellatus SS14]
MYQLYICLLLPLVAYALSRTSPPSGALVVRQSGTQAGEFSPGSTTAAKSIFIYPGTYHEQVFITYAGPLTVYGYTNDTSSYKNNQVTITNNLNAQDNGGNDPCATVRAHGNFFNLYNVNVANTYGQGKQATALSAAGSHQGYYGCSFTGYQDTLLADGGAVDWIYGDASAWFGECTITAVGPGAITAMSRNSATETTYYVIDHSEVISASSSSLIGETYLGRPWREYARVIFQFTDLPDIINPAGYTTLATLGPNAKFSEFENTGAGANTSARVDLTPISAAITKDQVWGSGWTEWTDTSY